MTVDVLTGSNSAAVNQKAISDINSILQENEKTKKKFEALENMIGGACFANKYIKPRFQSKTNFFVKEKLDNSFSFSR